MTLATVLRTLTERIMAILNIGLQNCATERTTGEEDFEKLLKSCNSMQGIRDLAKKNPIPTLLNCGNALFNLSKISSRNVFHVKRRSNSPNTVTEDEVIQFQRHTHEMFPGMDINQLQKVHTNKMEWYIQWKKLHCRETHYTFQIRKCSNLLCCLPPKRPIEEFIWLPSPILKADKAHYMNYESVIKLEITDEMVRPTLKINKDKDKKKDPSSKPTNNQKSIKTFVQESAYWSANTSNSTSSSENVGMSAQTARAVVHCVECRKSRVVYAKTKIDIRHKMMLARNISSFEFTCGAHLFQPTEKRKRAMAMILRPNLSCAMEVEIPYYGA